MVLDSQDIEDVLSLTNYEDRGYGVTGLMVRVGEGEYTDIWASWYGDPFDIQSVYEKIL